MNLKFYNDASPKSKKWMKGIGIVLALWIIGVALPDKKEKEAPNPGEEATVLHGKVRPNKNDSIIAVLSAKGKLNKEEKKILQNAKWDKREDSMMLALDNRTEYVKDASDRFKKDHVVGGMVMPVAFEVRNRLNDPESFEHAESFLRYEYEDNVFVVKMTYRAKNAFGALILRGVNAKVSPDGTVISMEEIK